MIYPNFQYGLSHHRPNQTCYVECSDGTGADSITLFMPKNALQISKETIQWLRDSLCCNDCTLKVMNIDMTPLETKVDTCSVNHLWLLMLCAQQASISLESGLQITEQDFFHNNMYDKVYHKDGVYKAQRVVTRNVLLLADAIGGPCLALEFLSLSDVFFFSDVTVK